MEREEEREREKGRRERERERSKVFFNESEALLGTAAFLDISTGACALHWASPSVTVSVGLPSTPHSFLFLQVAVLSRY